MGEVVNIRDYQGFEAQERARKALEEHMAQEANRIMNEALWNQDAGSIAEPYVSFNFIPPDKDPA